MEFKHVIVMRKDLNMRKGKMIAQGAHASLKVVLDYNNHEYVKLWCSGLFKKICVSIDSEKDLLDLYHKVKAFSGDNIPRALILDSGLTEFGGVATYTCCAIGPAPSDIIDIFTGELKLL